MELKLWKQTRDKLICELGRSFPLIKEISTRLGIDEKLVRDILRKHNINFKDKISKRDEIFRVSKK